MKILDGVFEGGGVRGIAHVGAVQAIEEHGYEWNRLAGTSSGSIVAALLACGYSGSELLEIMESLDYQDFMKKNWINHIPFIGNGINLAFKGGLYKNRFQEEWINELLAKKNVHSFRDLEEGKLKIIVSDITNGRMAVFPDDLEKYGETYDFSIAKAVTMSSTIPYYFQPIKWKTNKYKSPIYMVDGGILSNFPIWIFDTPYMPKWPTFGFHFTREETNPDPSENLGTIGIYKSIFKTMLQAHDLRHLDKEADTRTVKIPTGNISITDFGLSESQEQWLYHSGYDAASTFLETWNFEEYKRKFRSEFVNV
ncbi:patatin-like phospholipase family protein [Pontibacillus marinus]|uniref:Phospholipase n=1 Tax=Pontibacillus marinus BH030004 = DSM 16465 TaxID=1385511 RepID=A0A0A5I2Q0_9BACI|nr:patatin-like phospholipase family protein [Pontibacillus marinus]KGX90127.1 phospholipase [Pontibacillus marinus BH030004 = DSM 16465]